MSFEELVARKVEAQKWDEVVELCSEHELKVLRESAWQGQCIVTC